MKTKILYQFVIFALLVMSSCGGGSSDGNRPVKVVSVADLAIQSKLERVDPGGPIDSAWVQTLVSLHNIDQQVCFLAAETESQESESKAEIIGEALAQGNQASVRIMNSCCPCNGVCCGCFDNDFAAATTDVSDLILTSDSRPTDTPITAEKTPLDDGKITAFRFVTANIAEGSYTMTIVRPNQPAIQFQITFKDSKWSVKRGGPQ